MQSAVLPKNTCLEIEKLVRQFVWGNVGGLGFRYLSVQNDAFLMMIGYNIFARKDTLWVKLLRAKYKCVDRVPMILHGSRCSRLWKGLGLIWEDVKNNISWQVGHGQYVSFWFDNWVPDLGPLTDYVATDRSTLLRDRSVASFAMDSGEWRWCELEQLLPPHVLLRLAAIKCPLPCFDNAKVRWSRANDLHFTVKSAYLILNVECTDVADREHEFPESVLLRSVHQARLMISAVGGCTSIGDSTTGSQLQLSGWSLPTPGRIKLNTDGAQWGPAGCFACGGIARDHEGRWLFGFNKALGRCSIKEAELWGILIGLECAWNAGFRQVMVECDSLDVVRLLRGDTCTSPPLVLHISGWRKCQ
ncbi:hypothetical protein V6N13_030637 [Hibiscus sabdariffa]